MVVRHRISNQKILVHFLIPYVTILLITLGIGTFLYYRTVKVMKEETIKGNIRTLEQSREILEGRLNEIDMIVGQLNDNSTINRYRFVTEPFKGTMTYRTLEAFNELYNYSLLNNFIFDYYIYYHNSDLILTSKTTYKFKTFYDEVYSYQEMDSESWRQILTGRYFQKDYLASRPMTVNNQTQTMVTHIQSLGYPMYSLGTIVVLIDNRKIQSIFSGLDLSEDCSVYIMDESGNILSMLSSAQKKVIPIQIPEKRYGFFNESVDGEKMMVTYTTSPNNGWTYVVVQPASNVMNKVNYITKTTFTTIFISLIIGVLFAYYLANRNSKPLKMIIKKLMGRLEEPVSNSRGMFDIIEDTLSGLISSHDELQKKMKEQIPVLRSTFFEHLIKGEFISERDIERSLSHIGISLMGNYYTIIILFLNQYNLDEISDHLVQLDGARILVKKLISGIIKDTGYIHDLAEDRIALLFVSQSETLEECKREVSSIVSNINDCLHQQLDISSSAVIGGSHKNITDISLSYEEAKRVLYSRFSKMEDTILWYDRLSFNLGNYYYPADIENRLINFIKAGEVKEVDRLFLQLYNDNFVCRQLSISIARLYLYDMVGSIMKISDSLNDKDQYAMIDIEKMLVEINSFKEIYHIFEYTRQVCLDICQKISHQKMSHNVRLKNNIIEYIGLNYIRHNINLSMVASHFKISEVYLSRFFKEQTGENFSGYLENVRMDRARELLADTHISIKEISYKVGYITPETFGRAFKRIHGMSATKYRKM